MRPISIVLAHLALFIGAASVSHACSVNYPETAFRCNPAGDDPRCPEGYICCSDDAAAIDLSAGTNNLDNAVLPAYTGGGGTGVPMFSGGNNVLSRSGMCVQEGLVVPGMGGLSEPGAQGCPIPCNPTWAGAQIQSVCGANTICCQTVELQPSDCINDGVCFRPVRGTDIGVNPPSAPTTWSAADHATHQDPGPGSPTGACATFVVSGNLGAATIADPYFSACLDRLTVADQRGFCLGIDPANGVVACPATSPDYLDACEMRNLNELGLPGGQCP